jgi:hypothetical protein
MRLIFPYFLSGLLVVCLIAGCGRAKSTDDGSGPRDVAGKMATAKTKSDKPEMKGLQLPPKPPGTSDGPKGPQGVMPPKPPAPK